MNTGQSQLRSATEKDLEQAFRNVAICGWPQDEDELLKVFNELLVQIGGLSPSVRQDAALSV